MWLSLRANRISAGKRSRVNDGARPCGKHTSGFRRYFGARSTSVPVPGSVSGSSRLLTLFGPLSQPFAYLEHHGCP